MKKGDFVEVHSDNTLIGTQIGRFVSDDGDTVSVLLNILNFGAIVFNNIPKEIVTPYISMQEE